MISKFILDIKRPDFPLLRDFTSEVVAQLYKQKKNERKNERQPKYIFYDDNNNGSRDINDM